MFNPTDSATQMLLDTTLTTFGKEVTAKANESTCAQAKVCYHEVVRGPGDDAQFTLAMNVEVAGRAKEAGQQGACTPTNFGSFVPLKVWQDEDASASWYKLVWVCKWTTNGLMPVRPVIIAARNVQIPGMVM